MTYNYQSYNLRTGICHFIFIVRVVDQNKLKNEIIKSVKLMIHSFFTGVYMPNYFFIHTICQATSRDTRKSGI